MPIFAIIFSVGIASLSLFLSWFSFYLENRNDKKKRLQRALVKNANILGCIGGKRHRWDKEALMNNHHMCCDCHIWVERNIH